MAKHNKPSEYEPLARAQKKYENKTKRYTLRFLNDELYLYKYAKGHKNMNKYIKELILKDYKLNHNKGE